MRAARLSTRAMRPQAPRQARRGVPRNASRAPSKHRQPDLSAIAGSDDDHAPPKLSRPPARACGKAPHVTVDTEFLRETTFWPKLCVVQLADAEGPEVVDALAPGIDLAPLFELMADEAVLKVFHSGRQDIEIFHHLSGKVPHPVFDTQVAAMVLGFGDSISYDQLVAAHDRRCASTSPRASPTGAAGRSPTSRSPMPSPTSRICATSTPSSPPTREARAAPNGWSRRWRC